MTKPADWPRYMKAKRLSGGRTAYYWAPTDRDIAAGFTLHAEALGLDYGVAIARAEILNKNLFAWRKGLDVEKTIDTPARIGTLDWLVEKYTHSKAWRRVSEKQRPHYRYIMNQALNLQRKSGLRVGEFSLTEVDAECADRLYDMLKTGPRGERLRVATMAIMRIAKAWDVVERLAPQIVPNRNPFRGVTLEHGDETATPATRDDALALHAALVAAGEPHLAAVPLICYEWHQRPENVLAGSLTWNDYRPAARRDAVRIEHAKTGAELWQPLVDVDDGSTLFPELTAYLDSLARLGVPIVLKRHSRKRRDASGELVDMPPMPYTLRDARMIVRKVARKAGLPDWLSMAACRHGGMTELGDAGATEAEVMASSGHSTPDAARLYVKRTEAQRMSAARKRKALRENKRA